MTEQVSILVVDDDWIARGFVSDALHGLGTVTSAGSAEEAVDILKREGANFDMVITDLIMVGDSGINLLRYIRQELQLNDIPILVYSAHDDERIESMVFEAGATEFIAKPMRFERFRNRVAAQLALRQASLAGRGELNTLGVHPTKAQFGLALLREFRRSMDFGYSLRLTSLRFSGCADGMRVDGLSLLALTAQFCRERATASYFPVGILNADTVAFVSHGDAPSLTEWPVTELKSKMQCLVDVALPPTLRFCLREQFVDFSKGPALNEIELINEVESMLEAVEQLSDISRALPETFLTTC